MARTVRLTMAQALVRAMAAQKTEINGKVVPIFSGSPCTQVCWCSLRRVTCGRRWRRIAPMLSTAISPPTAPRKNT